jgi:multimeric flavodoxin WrbA
MGCKACDTCYSKGKPCSFDDDFNSIAPLIEKTDAIIFITPLYGFSFPTQLKAVIDKTYSFIIGEKKLDIKESMLLVCGGDDDESVFNAIISTYKQIAYYQKWSDRGHLVVPGVNSKGDIIY